MQATWQTADNVLCMRLDSIGDVLMTTPAIRALKEARAGRRITLLTSDAGARVARLVPEIDDVRTFDAPWMKTARGSPASDSSVIAQLAASRFDAAVIFTVYSQNPLPAAYMCYLACIPLRLAHCRENPYQLLSDWIQDPEPLHSIRHEVRRQLDLVAAIGCRATNEQLSFAVPKPVRRRIASLLAQIGVDPARPLVVAHPGASAASRRYPPESFARALRLLGAQTGSQILLTGDAGEIELVNAIRLSIGACQTLAGKLDLAELGALIRAADVLISNNTAPVHIAAAVGTAVVDLYALTNPQHTPWQVESRVLYHDVPCRYCYKSVCPAGHHECLRLVAPEEVAAAAVELLDATRHRTHRGRNVFAPPAMPQLGAS